MDEIQPNPIKNNRPAVWDLVLQDMKYRDTLGEKNYGTRLQPFNGRDALKDAYDENLDQSVYLRQAIYEEEVRSQKIKDLLEMTEVHIPFYVYGDNEAACAFAEIIRTVHRLLEEF